MGMLMSFLGKKAIKPIKNYNVEERAHKILTKDKLNLAPRHPTHRKTQENVIKESEELQKLKEDEFSKRLSKVFVTSVDSKDKNEPIQQSMPKSRVKALEHEFGFHQPERVPYGRVTLKNALEFISKYQKDNKITTAKEIARENKIDEKITENILKYFSVFTVINSTNNNKKQSVLKTILWDTELKETVDTSITKIESVKKKLTKKDPKSESTNT